MNKATYLKIIGIIELIGFVIGLISYIIAWATNAFLGLHSFLPFLFFLLLLFFGPAVGVLFLAVADNIEKIEALSGNQEKQEKKINEVKKAPAQTVVVSSGKTYPKPTRVSNSVFNVGQHVTTIKDYKDMFGRKIPSGTEGVITKVYSSSLEILFKVNDSEAKVTVNQADVIK